MDKQVKNNHPDTKALLSYALSRGIIDINTVRLQVDMYERQKYLDMHSHKIWKGKNGLYYTYLSDPHAKNERRLVKRNCQSALHDAIIRHYKQAANEPYIQAVFYEWAGNKLKYGEIQQQTYDRYEADFKRFIEKSSLAKIRLRYITEEMLEDFIWN